MFMEAEQCVFIYVTASGMDEARRIGATLVRERLAACINVWEMSSAYWWEGELQEDKEAVLLVKTTEANIERVKERILSLHSYQLPCIVWWRVDGHREYCRWIADNVMKR